MMRSTRMATAAVVVSALAAGAWGQMSIEPPASQPSAPPAPSVVETPTTVPSTSAPSAQSVMDNLLKDKPQTTPDATPAPVAKSGPADRTVVPAVPEVAPNARKTNRLREGEFVWERTGRLVKDEKAGSWFFDFEADGKNMKDPPMVLIPSKLLNAMEQGSDEGRVATRFKVSGEVTEYGGKNYLWVQHMEILRELNKGIGG